jgi:hypothetical protein
MRRVSFLAAADRLKDFAKILLRDGECAFNFRSSQV